MSLIGRFTFHLDPATYAKLAMQRDVWIVLVPSEGGEFLLVPLADIDWPSHVGPSAGKTKWLSMRLQPTVEERWAKYAAPLDVD